MNVEINYKKRNINTNTCILNNTVLNNQWITEEIKEEIKKKYLDTNENANTMTQNLWDVAKADLRLKLKQV